MGGCNSWSECVGYWADSNGNYYAMDSNSWSSLHPYSGSLGAYRKDCTLYLDPTVDPTVDPTHEPTRSPMDDSTTRRTCYFPLFSLPETGTDERCDHVACPKRTEAACLVQHRTFGETCEVHCANGNPGVETWKCADSDAGPSFIHAFTWERVGPALDCGLTGDSASPGADGNDGSES